MLPLPGSRYARTVLMVLGAPLEVGGRCTLAEVLSTRERFVAGLLLPGAARPDHTAPNVKSLERRRKEPVPDADAAVHVEAAGAGQHAARAGPSPHQHVSGDLL